jgi:hypothetical protein
MSSAIEDPSALCGETLHDHDGGRIGQIGELYGMGESAEPMWLTVAINTGLGRDRVVFVPLARIKHEQDQVRTPYSAQHLLASPEVEPCDELAKADDLALRNYYAIGLADQEIRTNNESYAAQIPDADGSPRRTGGED